MKSCKCSKTEQHWVLAKVLRNAPAKIQRKNQRKIKKAKLEAVWTMRITWQILSNLSNLCLLSSSCEEIQVNVFLSRNDFIYIIGVKPETHKSTQSFSNKSTITIFPPWPACMYINRSYRGMVIFVRKGQNVKQWLFLSSAWLTYLVDINYLVTI